MRRIERHFPLSHGVPRVDDRRIISGIIFIIRNGLRWRDAPKEYGPTRSSTTASSVGAGSACSTRSSQSWRRKAGSPVS